MYAAEASTMNVCMQKVEPMKCYVAKITPLLLQANWAAMTHSSEQLEHLEQQPVVSGTGKIPCWRAYRSLQLSCKCNTIAPVPP